MPEKSPELWEALRHMLAWIWVPVLAMWGGAIRYYREGAQFSFWRFVWEMSISAFVGILTGLICQASGMSAVTTAALVGIAGHAGGTALVWFEKWAQSKIEALK